MATTNLPTHTTALTFSPSSRTPRTPTITVLPLPRTLAVNEVLIKVHHAALNPVDTQILHFPPLRIIPGLYRSAIGLGKDFSGTIAAVGSGVTESEWAMGEEVMGLLPGGRYFVAPGTLSEYILLTTSDMRDTVARKPRGLSFSKAAALPLVTLTAFSCIEFWLPTLPTDTAQKRQVVVIGASGGVGILAVQLAKQVYNCTITAICSGRNEEFVRSLGADHVIDYTTLQGTLAQQLLVHRPEGYDLIIDCVGGTGHGVFDDMKKLLPGANASFVTIVGDRTSRLVMGGPITYLTHPSQILRYLKGWLGWAPRYGCILLTPKKKWLVKAAGMAERGELRVEIEAEFGVQGGDGWKDAGDKGWKRAFEVLDEGRSRGKVVVRVE
ncbi:hypothetical protein BDZ91DRAFT_693667 [Kalaharituber pfeilii]|nr:hypothetical protein BDZ91DRAFT_693667 [Kalaharituber pfeilii]